MGDLAEDSEAYEDLIGFPEPPGWAERRAVEEAGREYADELLAQPEDVLRAALYQVAANDPKSFILAKHGVSQEQLDVEEEVRKLRVRHEGRRRFDAELLPEQDPPAFISLTDLLSEPDEDVRYLVEGLWPVDGKIVLAAQNKSGKTILVGNLIRSLVDGDLFLDRFDVDKVNRVVLIDNELPPGMVRRWLRDQGIRKTDAVDVLSLRGRLSSFNILDPAVRAEWAARIGSADVLIFDPLRPALDALGLSEDKDSGRFLEALDELVAAAAIRQLGLVHHMGHSNERSRGDSRIEDWPDAKWKIVKLDPGDGTEEQLWPRFFSAFGRDVEQGEVELLFNPLDRRLSVKLGGGNRAKAKVSKMEEAILAYVGGHPGCSQGKIEMSVPGDDKAIRKSTSRLEDDGRLCILPGPNRSKLHYLPEAVPNVENS